MRSGRGRAVALHRTVPETVAPRGGETIATYRAAAAASAAIRLATKALRTRSERAVAERGMLGF
jgi:hypothetical protein